MLKTLNRLHTPDLLHVLASMGHGDDVALVDVNFPAVSHAQRLVRLDGANLIDALQAVLQLLPLDTFVEAPVGRMMQVHTPHEVPAIQQECQMLLDKAEGRSVKMEGIERGEFYDRTRKAFAIILTSEQRSYGCILLKKGVTFEAEAEKQ